MDTCGVLTKGLIMSSHFVQRRRQTSWVGQRKVDCNSLLTNPTYNLNYRLRVTVLPLAVLKGPALKSPAIVTFFPDNL